MSSIKQLKYNLPGGGGQQVYPLTSLEAVVDESGKTLEVLLSEVYDTINTLTPKGSLQSSYKLEREGSVTITNPSANINNPHWGVLVIVNSYGAQGNDGSFQMYVLRSSWSATWSCTELGSTTSGDYEKYFTFSGDAKNLTITGTSNYQDTMIYRLY